MALFVCGGPCPKTNFVAGLQGGSGRVCRILTTPHGLWSGCTEELCRSASRRATFREGRVYGSVCNVPDCLGDRRPSAVHGLRPGPGVAATLAGEGRAWSVADAALANDDARIEESGVRARPIGGLAADSLTPAQALAPRIWTVGQYCPYRNTFSPAGQPRKST